MACHHFFINNSWWLHITRLSVVPSSNYMCQNCNGSALPVALLGPVASSTAWSLKFKAMRSLVPSVSAWHETCWSSSTCWREVQVIAWKAYGQSGCSWTSSKQNRTLSLKVTLNFVRILGCKVLGPHCAAQEGVGPEAKRGAATSECLAQSTAGRGWEWRGGRRRRRGTWRGLPARVTRTMEHEHWFTWEASWNCNCNFSVSNQKLFSHTGKGIQQLEDIEIDVESIPASKPPSDEDATAARLAHDWFEAVYGTQAMTGWPSADAFKQAGFESLKL